MANKGSEKERSRPFVAGCKHWLPRLAGGALALVVVAFIGERVAAKLVDPQSMKIQSVQVEGVFERVKPEAIKRVVASFSEQGFLGVDVGQVKLAIETLPWVKQAAVRRVWPDTLYISLQEQVVAARWGESALVNPEGGLFFPQNSANFTNYPELVGPGSDGVAVLAKYAKVREMLAAQGLLATHLAQDERRAWVVTLSNGVKLLLGRKESELRLARFIDLYPKVLQQWVRSIDEVDLRYANGFAVRWHAAAGKEREITRG